MIIARATLAHRLVIDLAPLRQEELPALDDVLDDVGVVTAQPDEYTIVIRSDLLAVEAVEVLAQLGRERGVEVRQAPSTQAALAAAAEVLS